MDNEAYEASLEPKFREMMGKNNKSMQGRFTYKMNEEELTQLLDGAYDTHIHAAPDSYAWRPVSMSDVAKKAVDYNMGGVAFKTLWAPSSAQKLFVQEIADSYAEARGKRKVDIITGVCLQMPVGGINPYAVEASFKVGGKYVWTPGTEASHHKKAFGYTEPGIEVVDENGRLLPQMYEILKMIAENDGVLGISHQSTKERFLMVREAQKLGVQRIIIEHPQLHVSRLTLDQLKEFANMGVFLGLTYIAALPNYLCPDVDVFELSSWVKEIGTRRWVSQTDLTQVQTPHPVEGLRILARALMAQGISEKDIRIMFVDNPKELLY